jgi:hypothetical protein
MEATFGDHVILGMDANEDVRRGETDEILGQAGLCEIILELHNDQSPPATHNRNNKRELIDGFWTTRGITITKGGYLAFGEGFSSDHHALWFEALHSVALGQRLTEMALLQPKRLKSKDPRLAKKYIKQVKLKMKTTGFQTRFNAFKMNVTTDWNKMMLVEYNWLQNENTTICKEVESKLRKLFMGGVPWSPEIQILRDKIEAWYMLVRKKKNVQVSVKCIRRFLKKVPSITNAFTCTLPEALQSRQMAFLEYRSARKLDALKWRETFQGTLAEAIALKKGTDVETEAKNLRRIELQRRQARNVKRMRGKRNNNRVNKLWYTEDDGTRVQCDTHILQWNMHASQKTRLASAKPKILLQ